MAQTIQNPNPNDRRRWHLFLVNITVKESLKVVQLYAALNSFEMYRGCIPVEYTHIRLYVVTGIAIRNSN